METVLVTGAAGTVGNYVVALAEAEGLRVIASDVSARDVQMPVRGEVRPGDLRDPAFVERLVRGADHVIHTAALLDAEAEPASLDAINRDAVGRLFDAASAAGVGRFVHVSTSLVYAAAQRGPLAEDAALGPRGPYGRSKLGAEELLRARSNETRWTILRPAPLYGRRGRHLAASLLAVGPILRLATPVLPRPTGGPHASCVHAEDVARAALFALRTPESAGRVLNVADQDPLPLGERVAETLRAYGLPTVPAGTLPRSVLDRIGRAFARPTLHSAADRASLAAWSLVVRRHGLKPALRVRLDREAVTLLHDDLVLDCGALSALGWSPRYPRFAEGWRQVLRWYQAEGWVPRYA